MANRVSLLDYLQRNPPLLPTTSHSNGMDFTPPYTSGNLPNLTEWREFDLETILDQYETLLAQTMLPDDPFPASPPLEILSENHLRYRVAEYIVPLVRRALRTTFRHLESMNQINGRTIISFDGGAYDVFPGEQEPEITFFALFANDSTRHRLPGTMRLSWEWNSTFQDGEPSEQNAYQSAVSTLEWYMRHRTSRYGFILTDAEFVAVRRMENGDLQLSAPIAWGTCGSFENPELTVLLALWYLGMLASENNGPDRWTMSTQQIPVINGDYDFPDLEY